MHVVGRIAMTLALLAFAAAARAGDAPRAIDAIENDLVADDPAVRAKAAAELTDRFPDGAVAVPMLVDLLDDEDAGVVAAAAKAIDSMAVAGAGPLVNYFSDESHWKPGAPLANLETMLVQIGLVGDLLDADGVRAGRTSVDDLAIVAALPRLQLQQGQDRSRASWLVWLFRHTTEARRTTCAAAIAMDGAELVTARRIAPSAQSRRDAVALSVIPLVQSKRDFQKWAGARIIARLRSTDAKVGSALGEVIASTESRQTVDASLARLAAYQALDAIGPTGVPTVAQLQKAGEKETDEFVLAASARAIVRLARDSDVTSQATSGSAAGDAVALALASELRVPDTLITYFVNGLSISEKDERTGLSGIASFGRLASAALPAVKQQAAKAGRAFRRSARYADAILAIDPADADSLRTLAELNTDLVKSEMLKSDPGRPIALLARRAAPTQLLVSQLQGVLGDSENLDWPCDFNVVDGIARCGRLAVVAVPTLLRLLAAADKQCVNLDKAPQFGPHRRRIVIALGRIGPDAAAAIPALTALRDKGDETIRAPAAQALRRIRAKK